MKRLVIIFVATAFILTASTVFAATVTNNLDVTASVNANCSITSVTNVNFSTPYDPTDGSPNDSGQGDFTWRCTKGTAYDIYITGARTMTNGTDTLNFELYEDAGRTNAWEAASPGLTGTSADNSPTTTNIYGRIPALQDVGTGAYSGTVVITIEF